MLQFIRCLRLMYADQLSPIGTLFKFEQFDPPLLRDTVGRLVFGAYENELYANELRLRELGNEFTSVSSELAAISKLVGQSGQVLTPSWLEAEHKRIEEERAAVEVQISEVERTITRRVSKKLYLWRRSDRPMPRSNNFRAKSARLLERSTPANLRLRMPRNSSPIWNLNSGP